MDIFKTPLPFYSLEQAVSILNQDTKYQIFEPESLLLMALNYDLKLHVLFTGNWNVNIEHKEGFDHDDILKTVIKLSSHLSNGGLFELNQMSLKYLYSGDKTKSFEYYFLDCVPIADVFLYSENYIREVIQGFNNLPFPPHTLTDFKFTLQTPFIDSSPVDSRLSCDFELFGNAIDQHEGDLFFPIIGLNNIYITYKELNNILNNNLTVRTNHRLKINDYMNTENSNKFKTIGVSQAKLNAKLAAQTLADYFWKKDTDKKIKIKDMAIQIYAELYNTEHKEQLPNDQISIKDWIVQIADKYPHSRAGGRTKQ